MVGVSVVGGAVRNELHAELLRHRSEPALPREVAFRIHVEKLRIMVAEPKGRQFIAFRLQVQIVHVVVRSVSQDDRLRIF